MLRSKAVCDWVGSSMASFAGVAPGVDLPIGDDAYLEDSIVVGSLKRG
jgi:hypothetical protein